MAEKKKFAITDLDILTVLAIRWGKTIEEVKRMLLHTSAGTIVFLAPKVDFKDKSVQQ